MSEQELRRPSSSARMRTETAGAVGEIAWQREVVASTVDDPWACLEQAAGHRDWFAWHDGSRGLSFVAWGAVDRCQPAGKARFAAVRGWLSKLHERLPVDPATIEAALPLALGGFAFAPRDADDATGRWRRWPDAAFTVPERMILRLPTGMTVESTIRAGSEVALCSRPLVPPPPRVSEDLSLEGRERYEALVHSTVNRIEAGRLDKAVVARPATRRAPPGSHFDPVAVLRALRDGHPRALCFAVGRDDEVFVGASPETLVAMRAGALSTQAVAGTTRADDDADGRRLRASVKDDHEHALVVQSIEQALAPLCHRLQIGSRRLARAGDVHHIVTPIEAAPRPETTVLDAVAALHPTAALCGTPRQAAAAWLADREGFDRGWYGAPIGWLGSDGDGVFAVAIRSALVSPRRATAFVGAGIVRGSSPRAEWDETDAKLGPLRRAIDIGTVSHRTDGHRTEGPDPGDGERTEAAATQPRRLS